MVNDTKKILVLGGSGQVGSAVLKEAERRNIVCVGTYFRHAYPGLVYWDGDSRALEKLIHDCNPEAVVYALGMTNVDACEASEEETFAWNAVIPARTARLCAGKRAFVYFSTEYVFDGENGPYSEDDPPNPVSVYGHSKLQGERDVLSSDPEALVLRTTVVYGPEEQKKNFVYSLRKRLSQEQRVMAPRDQISSPTYNSDLARITLELLKGKKTGIWNVTGPEIMDRYSFALLAAEAFGLNKNLIVPVFTAELRQTARRPLRAGLRIDKLKTFAGRDCMKPPKEGLSTFAAEEREKE